MLCKIPQDILEHPAFLDVDRDAASNLLDNQEVGYGQYILVVNNNEKLKYPKYVYILLSARGDMICEHMIDVHYFKSANKVKFGNTKTNLDNVMRAVEKFFRKEGLLDEQDRFLPYGPSTNENWNGQKNINAILREYTITSLQKKLKKSEERNKELKCMIEEKEKILQELDKISNQKTITC